jgi:hypothetical protein
MGYVIRPGMITPQPREGRWINASRKRLLCILTKNVERRKRGGTPHQRNAV